MADKLKQEKIDEAVQAAHTQAAYLIETMFRQSIEDFEKSDSDDFSLVLTINGHRERGGGVLTVQTDGVSNVKLKRKNSTPAATIDYGPTLFDQAKAEEEKPKGKKGRKLLKAAPKLLKAAEPEDGGGAEPVEGEVVD